MGTRLAGNVGVDVFWDGGPMSNAAYDRLSEASSGQDVVVPVRLSVLTQLLDLRVRPEDREKLIAHYVEVIKNSNLEIAEG